MYKRCNQILIATLTFVFVQCLLDKGDAKPKSDYNNPDGLYINEVVANDKDNGPDWIELYIGGTKPVDLSKYSLRDDNDSHELAPLPDLILKPGTFIVIMASDTLPAPGVDYVPFQLGTSDGVFLFLKDEIVDSYTWKKEDLEVGASLGRLPDGTGILQSLSPTPANNNQKFD